MPGRLRSSKADEEQQLTRFREQVRRLRLETAGRLTAEQREELTRLKQKDEQENELLRIRMDAFRQALGFRSVASGAEESPLKQIENLRKRRYERIRHCARTQGLKTVKAFCKHYGFGRSTLEGIVRDEKRKFGPEKREQLLRILSVTLEEWNKP